MIQCLLSQFGVFPLIFIVPGPFQQSHLAITMSKDQTGSRLKEAEEKVILRRLNILATANNLVEEDS